MKAIVEPAQPTPKKRRRTDETRGAFTLAATNIIRWMKQLKPPPTIRRTRKPPFADRPFEELHEPELWQWSDPDAGNVAFGELSATVDPWEISYHGPTPYDEAEYFLRRLLDEWADADNHHAQEQEAGFHYASNVDFDPQP